MFPQKEGFPCLEHRRFLHDISNSLILTGLYTPYKRWSKFIMEKGGGTFLQEVMGEMQKFPVQNFKKSFILALVSLIMY